MCIRDSPFSLYHPSHAEDFDPTAASSSVNPKTWPAAVPIDPGTNPGSGTGPSPSDDGPRMPP
eukprot:10461349-Karenia_brevis.AAC.1